MKKDKPIILPTGQIYKQYVGTGASETTDRNLREWTSEAVEIPCTHPPSTIILHGTVTNLTTDAEQKVSTFHMANGNLTSGAIQLYKAELPEWFEDGALITLDTGAMTIRLHKSNP